MRLKFLLRAQLLGALALSACTFDSSRLTECFATTDCTSGLVCVDGACVDPAGFDVDTPDTPDVEDDVPPGDGGGDVLPDAGDEPDAIVEDAIVEDPDAVQEDVVPDGPDAIAEDLVDQDVADEPDLPSCPATPTCEGNELVRCDEDDQEERIDCDDASVCGNLELGCRCSTGACLTRVCIPNLLTCDGIDVVECDETGADFDFVETCDFEGTGEGTGIGDPICIGGACGDDFCEPNPDNELFCSQDVVVSCTEGGTIEVLEDCRRTGFCFEDEDNEAACVPFFCEPGALSCGTDEEAGLDTVVECNARGEAFQVIEYCTATQSCAGGACTGPVCEANTAVCAGLAVRAVCRADGSGEDLVDCEDDEFCDESGENAVCTEQICEPLTVQCAGVGEAVEQCNEAGSDFYPPEACTSEQFCEDGVCLPQVCEPDELRCEGDFTLLQCDARGSQETEVGCDDDEFCDAAGDPPDCDDQVCNPGTTTCLNETTLSTCNSAGSNATSAPCNANQFCNTAANPDACVADVCTPGDTNCIDLDTVETCDPFGSAFVQSQCDTDEYCDPVSDECQPDECTPDETQCDDLDTLETCDAFGSGFDASDCLTSQYCRSAPSPAVCAADVCTANSEQCSAGGTDNVEHCDSFGSGFSVEDCTFSCGTTGCVAGQDACCQSNFCGDGYQSNAEACDDDALDTTPANQVACDGCETCELRNHLIMVGTTDTDTNASWGPGNGVFTIEAWVLATGDGNLLGIGDALTMPDFAVLRIEGGIPQFEYLLGNGANDNVTVSGSTSILDGEWHHLAASRVDSTGGIDPDDARLFVDGVMFTQAQTMAASTLDNGEIWIGDIDDIPGGAAAARIDEVRFSNTVRYTAAFTPSRRFTSDANTMALYHLDAGTGTLLDDASSNNRDINMDGSVTWDEDDCYGGRCPNGAASCPP